MASKRPKTKSITSAPARVQRFALFGPPPLLEGEDAALYDDLLGRMCAAVKPVDIIEEMLVADVVFSEWDIVRLRRVRISLLQACVYSKLEGFLTERLKYEAYVEAFVETLTEVIRGSLQKNLAEDQAKQLAQQYARSEPEAVKNVRVLLKAAGRHADDILDQAKEKRAEELTQAYTRREPEATKQVNELLASRGRTMHDIVVELFPEVVEKLEPIDRLITIAETRRNVSLREIDRRRAVLGEALRRNVQEVEGEFEVIETPPPEGKSPA